MTDPKFATIDQERLTPSPRIAHQEVVPGGVPAGKLELFSRNIENAITVPAGTVALQAAVDAQYVKQDKLVIVKFRYTPLVGGGFGNLQLNLPYPGSEEQPYCIGSVGNAAGYVFRVVPFDIRTRQITFAIPTFGDYYELQLEYETDYDG